MIDLNHCNEWQHLDPSNGLILPWYTKSFLDELVTWDLKDKIVFEYGCGASSLWWASRCKSMAGVEYNIGYANAVNKEVSQRYVRYSRSWPVAWFTFKGLYINHVRTVSQSSDIIIIDGDPVEWRDNCVKPALDCLKPGGKLIIDNWMQPSVWVPSEETRALLAPYHCNIYKQSGHPDWQTAVFTKI
jgi:predicted O-methyltransferase YrrM